MQEDIDTITNSQKLQIAIYKEDEYIFLRYGKSFFKKMLEKLFPPIPRILEISDFDFPRPITWYEATDLCHQLNSAGWRLATGVEFRLMYSNLCEHDKGTFPKDAQNGSGKGEFRIYWTSQESNNQAEVYNFNHLGESGLRRNDGTIKKSQPIGPVSNRSKEELHFVRFVRDLKKMDKPESFLI